MSELIDLLLGEKVLKVLALILFGIIGLVIFAALLAVYPLFVFIIMAIVASVGLKFIDENIDGKYIVGVFVFIVALGIALPYGVIALAALAGGGVVVLLALTKWSP